MRIVLGGGRESKKEKRMLSFPRPRTLLVLGLLVLVFATVGLAKKTKVANAVPVPGTYLPSYAELTAALDGASSAANGGIFTPSRMWASVVSRLGIVVVVTKTTGSDPWPGSRVIAVQKAYTATAFSNSGLVLSTANLYTAVQPGGSLYGLQHSNPVDAHAAYKGPAVHFGTSNDPVIGKQVGGVNVFGGGLALYHQVTGEVLGALGVSGDSSCADHVIAWRMRYAMGFVKIPGGVNTTAYGGAVPPAGGDDNIIYGGGGFVHPACGFSEAGVVDLPSMSNF